MGEGKEKRRTAVTINNQQYTIVSEESSEYVKDVAELVNKKMKEIKEHNPYLDSTKLAVLTAVNIGSEHLTLLKQLKDEKKDEE